MNFADANPLASCTAGGNGRQIMMVAYDFLPEDVTPVFQIHTNGSHRPDLDQFLVQPTKERWGSASVIRFPSPAQPYLQQIREDFSVKLTAKDSSGRVSENKWDFDYVQHKKSGASPRTGGGWQPANNGFGGGGYQGTGQDRKDCFFCGRILD